MPTKNDEVSSAISTAPASAVPTEAPRLVTVRHAHPRRASGRLTAWLARASLTLFEVEGLAR
jgi:hypothetical protein